MQQLSDLDLEGAWRAGASLAAGEPAEGLAGWRLSHRQASAALSIALRETGRVVRYADDALLVAALQDDLLAASLRGLYLEPLRRMRDGGAAVRQTLRAYFAAGGNVSSAAVALGVNRATVSSRLTSAEERIGRHLDAISAEMQTALRLDDIDRSPVPA
jgi:DNA-binding PucR family transcriptional regulator